MIVRSASAADIRRHIAGVIRAEQGIINTRLDSIMPGVRIARIEANFSRNQDTASFPLVMLEQAGVSTRWELMPSIVRREFRLNIWGFGVWDVSATNDDLIAELAIGVEEALLIRHAPTPLEGTDVMVYYDDTTPIDSVQFGTGQISGALIRGFSATFRCHVLQSAPVRMATS